MEGQQTPEAMRAWTITGRGQPTTVLKLSSAVPVPRVLPENAALIRISYVSLHPGSAILMHLIPRVFRGSPAIAETDFSGTVVAVGKQAPTKTHKVGRRNIPLGSRVFGSIPVPLHLKGCGALAEYVVVDVDSLAQVPETTSLKEAACLSVSAITATDLLDLAQVKEGQRVLINASSGGIGHFVAQLVRHAVGPDGYIVGICSQSNDKTSRQLGCDKTVDYHSTAERATVFDQLAGICQQHGQFDTIIDCHGSQNLWIAAEKLLKPGTEHPYATVGPKFSSMSFAGITITLFQMLWCAWTPVWAGGIDRSYRQAASFINQEKLERVRSLAADGVIRPHIEREWILEDAKEAYNVLLTGHAVGKLVVQIET